MGGDQSRSQDGRHTRRHGAINLQAPSVVYYNDTLVKYETPELEPTKSRSAVSARPAGGNAAHGPTIIADLRNKVCANPPKRPTVARTGSKGPRLLIPDSLISIGGHERPRTHKTGPRYACLWRCRGAWPCAPTYGIGDARRFMVRDYMGRHTSPDIS